MALIHHPQIFLSCKYLVSELCHKGDRGKQCFFLEDLEDYQEEKRHIMSRNSLVFSLLSRLLKITWHATCHYL